MIPSNGIDVPVKVNGCMFLPGEEHILKVLTREVLLWHHQNDVSTDSTSCDDDLATG
jgi:hypothetical protein